MRRFSLKNVLALGAACLSAAVLPSCAKNDSMLFIIGVYARKQGACEAKPEFESPLFDHGILDRAFLPDYRATLLIGNQLVQRGSRDRLRTETSRIALKGAEIKLESLDGQQLLDPFSTIATGFVDASNGTDPGLAVISATLVPARAVQSLPAETTTVVARVRVFGESLGGEEVESNELAFPIQVCNGCLVNYPLDAADPTETEYRCALDSTIPGNVDLPCTFGQDIPSPCTVCAAVSSVCLTPENNCAYNADACTTP